MNWGNIELQVRNLVSSSQLYYDNVLGEKAHRLGRKPRTARGRITRTFLFRYQEIICRRKLICASVRSFRKGILRSVFLHWPVHMVLIWNLSRDFFLRFTTAGCDLVCHWHASRNMIGRNKWSEKEKTVFTKMRTNLTSDYSFPVVLQVSFVRLKHVIGSEIIRSPPFRCSSHSWVCRAMKWQWV